jgi:hypothetical protein
MAYEFIGLSDVTKAHQRKQQRRLNELRFAWKLFALKAEQRTEA